MAFGSTILTWFEGSWHKGDIPVMKAADHGSWLGSTVFDGARWFEGIAPDLAPHCARLNRSAEALLLTPTVTTEDMIEMVREGLEALGPDQPAYIRPMYWGVDPDMSTSAIAPAPETTGFAISLEAVPMATSEATTTLTTTRFRRPTLDSAVVNAKAGCLYPNNARMLVEARSKGYGNALAADAMGNVAESATANVFIIRDGEVFTPIPNGTFLAGITRARHIANMRANGMVVHETVLSFDDVRAADEVFLSGNFSKLTPVTEFDGTLYQHGPVTKQIREMYWDWAHSGG